MKHLSFAITFLCCSLWSGAVLAKELCSGGLIPGIEKMARGIDITELDLFPTNLLQANGFRKTIMELTCDSQRTWKHPADTQGVEYKLPDQVAGINTNPAGVLDTKVEISGDTTEIKKSWSVKVGLSVDTGSYGAYSASSGYKDVQENVYKNNRSVAEVSIFFSLAIT